MRGDAEPHGRPPENDPPWVSVRGGGLADNEAKGGMGDAAGEGSGRPRCRAVCL
jgi:hypothetical protein